MYQLDPKSLRSLRWRRWSGIGSNVFFLGITSMLTDISSEMVTSILPIYLVFALGLTPLQFGFVDGLSQGAAALARLASGLIADRWQRNREVAALGYGISAVCKLVLLAAGNAWGLVSAAIAFDRVGKGIRTSPRDALISLSSIPERLGLAFGIHRALDTAGALIGPLVAFAILAVLPRAFDLVFVTSFFVAIAGLAALLCFVRNVRPSTDAPVEAERRSLKAALALLKHERFRAMLLIGAALGLFTVADSFVFLMLQRKLSTAAAWFPLFYVAVAIAYLVLAIPAGSLGDRFGRARMFIVGHVLLLIAGINLLMSGNGLGAGLLSLLLLGAYYACTDGVLMAMASRFVPSELRASGLGLVATANGVARLLASILFGALWNWRSTEFALTIFTIGLACALLFSTILLIRTQAAHARVAS